MRINDDDDDKNNNDDDYDDKYNDDDDDNKKDYDNDDDNNDDNINPITSMSRPMTTMLTMTLMTIERREEVRRHDKQRR
jgi:hypothetical protein